MSRIQSVRWLGLIFVTASGCYNKTTVLSSKLGGSVIWADAANVPASAQHAANVHVQLLNGGVPVAGQAVQLVADNCTIAQPGSLTDALGHTMGSVSCTLPVQETVHAAVTVEDSSVALSSVAAVNFYTAADGNNAVPAGVPLYASVNVLDANGSLRVDYAGTVHFSSTDSNATLPGDASLGAADRGSKVWPGALVLRTPGAQQVTVTDVASQQVLQRQPFLVGSLLKSSLQIGGLPDQVTAGQSVSITVTALAADDSIATNYGGTVAFFSDDPNAQLPQSYTFTAADQGQHVFSVILKSAGARSLTVNDSAGLTGPHAITQVAASSAASIQLTPASFCVAGVSCLVTASAVDAFGNVAASYTGQVTVTGGVAPEVHSFTSQNQGSAVFVLTLTVAGVQTINATDAAATPLQGSAHVSVYPAAATHLQLSSSPNVIAGQAQDVSLTALDAFSNIATSYLGVVTFSGTDSTGTYPGSYAFVATDAGQRLMPASLVWFTAGPQTISVADVSNPSIAAHLDVTVNNARVASLVVQGSASIDAGSGQSISVTAQDSYGNVALDFNDTVHFLSNDPSAVLPSDTAFSPADMGTMTFANVVLKSAGSRTIAAQDVQNSNVILHPLVVDVIAGAAAHLSFSGVATSAVVTEPFNVTIMLTDNYGNAATSYVGTVHLSSTDPNAQLAPDRTFTAADMGTATLNRGVIFNSIGTFNLILADTVQSGLTSTESSVVVQHGCYSYGNSVVPTLPGNGLGCWALQGLELDPNNYPWVVYNLDQEAEIVLEHWNGAQWDQFSNSNSTNNGLDPRFGCYSDSLVVSPSGVATVAYSNTNLYIEQWNSGTGNALDGSLTVPGIASSGNYSPSSLALDPNGNPLIAWTQGELHLLAYDGATWGPIGGSTTISNTGVNNTSPSLAVDHNGVPYVTWSDISTGNNDVYVMRYSGGAWSAVGTSMNAGGLSNNAGASVDAVVAIDDLELPWVAWDDDTSGTNQIYVQYFNGSAWVQLANSSTGGGISNTAEASVIPRIRIDSTNAPWVGWQAAVSGTSYAYMRRYNGSSWVEPITGSATGSGIIPYAGGIMFALDSNNHPVVAAANCIVQLCTYH